MFPTRTEQLKTRAMTLSVMLSTLLISVPVSATEEAGDLAKASQNPIGNIVSLPLQNNTSFGIGPDDAISNVFNIQPVYPMPLSENKPR